MNDSLGIAPEQVRLKQGDSAALPYGEGTGGSRSLLMGGMAIQGAAEKVIQKARQIAGHLLEAAEADLEFADGVFTVVGTDRRVSLGEVATAAETEPAALPEALRGPVEDSHHYDTPPLTYPNGCHVCELEIDEETGSVEILRYVVADDFGRVVNPLLVLGQVHGGCAQGIGQALLERTVYDPDSGQLLTGSFMDYCMPRADDLPAFEVTLVQDTPCATNPLGIKGAGEAGAIGAAPAVINRAGRRPLALRRHPCGYAGHARAAVAADPIGQGGSKGSRGMSVNDSQEASQDDLLAAITLIAERAGKEILAYYVEGDVEVKRKEDASPVTEADEAAEELILAMLSKLTPDIPAVSEEAFAAGQIPETGRRFWLVDPLDGTK